MIALWTRQKASLVALDVGTCSLRAVQLVRKTDGYHVYHWLNVETDPTSPDPPPVDVAGHLKVAFGPGAFKGRKVGLALAPPDVEYRLLDVPATLMTRKAGELREALQVELDRQLPWPAAESEVSAWPVLPAINGMVSTMVAAARTQAVQKYLDVLEARRLECRLADVVPNALGRLRAAQPAASHGENQVWGVLDMGFKACRLYLMLGDSPVYARVLRAGGRELTETLARALRVEFSVAEQYKRLYGIKPTDRGVRSVVGGLGRVNEEALPGMLHAILAKTLETLAADIERSFRFVLDRHNPSGMGLLYLVGGGARLRGLPQVLGQALGIEVRHFNPTDALRNAQLDASGRLHPACSPQNYPVLAACVGLAMKEDVA